MDLVRNIVVAALLFLIFIVLTSGRGFGDTIERAKAASDEAAPKRIESEDARMAAELRRVRAAEARRMELRRRCRVKPVMSESEIASCRVAYRELGEASQ